MPLVALVCAGLIGWGDGAEPAVAAEYQQVQAAAGRSPEAQVRLALWCEAHGLAAERARHLALAVLANPGDAAARGLLGLVARRDRWVAPGAVAAEVAADPAQVAALAEYDRKRSEAPYTADGQLAVGRWADEHGLPDQARAHFTAAVRLDPRRDEAWRRLGYKKHDGRWATDAELAAARLDAEAQRKADHHWQPLLEKLKAELARPSRRAEAEAGLAAVTDPRAVPSVARAFGGDGVRAVQLLGQIDSPAASKGLAQLALRGDPAEARRAAVETLRRRDPREYAGLLIPLIRKPIHYEVKSVNGPGSPGMLYVEGEKANVKRYYEPKSLIRPTDQLAIDRFGQPVIQRVLSSWAYSKGGRAFNPNILTGVGSSYDDFYSSSNLLAGDLTTSFNGTMVGRLPLNIDPAAAQMKSVLGSVKSLGDLQAQIQAGHKTPPGQRYVSPDLVFSPTSFLLSNGAIINPRDAAQQTLSQIPLDRAVDESIRSAVVSQQQLQGDVAQIDAQNRSIQGTNDRVVGLLNDVTGENLPADPVAWQRWWVNLLGYAFVEGQTQQNPTIIEVIPSGYQPEVAPSNIIRQGIYVSGMSCFGAGTAVQTLTGPRPIEDIRVGDLVLTQSTGTGALGYHPVTVTHHNPPAPTFRVKLGDDTVVASHFHRFWVAGRGWVMARDLKAGDPVRTLGGVRPVGAVEVGKVELVYNLDVADDASFFAGASAALVHDNTLPDPRLVPFDLPPDNPRAVAAR